MQHTINQTNPYLVEITIKESGKEYEKIFAQTLAEWKKNGKVKGFRQGVDIPNEIFFQHYNIETINQDAAGNLVDKLYRKVLSKETLIPVAPADIKEIKSLQPFEVIIEVEVLPTIALDEKKIGKIKLKKTPTDVTDAEVNEAIKQIETKFTTYTVDADATIEAGDRVMVDTLGYEKKDGKELSETKVDAFPLVIGSNTFIPGFEDKLIGAKANSTVEFEITFPKDYHATDFQGKKVFFVTKISDVEKAKKPEFNEEFIEGLRGVKTDLAGFKKILADEIKAEKEQKTRQDDEKVLLDKLLEVTPIEVGPKLLENEVQAAWEQYEKYLAQRGMKVAEYLEHIKKDEETYKKEQIEPEALNRIKAELILNELKKNSTIEVTEADIAAEIEKVMARFSSEDVKARLKDMMVPGSSHYQDIASRLKYQRIIDQFFE